TLSSRDMGAKALGVDFLVEIFERFGRALLPFGKQASGTHLIQRLSPAEPVASMAAKIQPIVGHAPIVSVLRLILDGQRIQIALQVAPQRQRLLELAFIVVALPPLQMALVGGTRAKNQRRAESEEADLHGKA